ncbi:MAG TPA: ferrochelatase [Hypericibacter adhaerens]|jgi:ferrochelatase|uniref:ferrochelatase n=1 Tax=Hypericibacter adhaerens TaxID=2602016 RepID=UPI002CA9698F|nr:ferrochelatase [Hypericibacter adhaerens]HWA41991.1 ferrochelatase [Hypericibacter adhaerens]
MRTAIVLFNLGGPDRPEAVEPFLRNLFSDPAILRVPGFLRGFLARTIARRRAPIARAVYDKLGGGSPLLPNTQAQARALEAALSDRGLDLGEVRCFVAMRYWNPFAEETVREVQRFAPDRIVMLPLYPQFSTTTTASSFDDWARAAAKAGLTVPMLTIRDYPTEPGFIAAVSRLTAERLPEARAAGSVKILFSAHGLPKKIVQAGDPYAEQVGSSVRAIAERLGLSLDDYEVCFQSRVGPLEWIGPYTDEEIVRAAEARQSILLVPVAFVSEHSETLVELDIEYRHLAEKHGAPGYVRVPTVGTAPEFIAGLADLVRRAIGTERPAVLPSR